jgi:hypothetical protein
MTPTNIDEARAMFSQPDEKKPPDKKSKPKRKSTTALTDAMVAKLDADIPPGDWTKDERLMLALAKKRRKKHAILDKGDDAILLFGKHSGSKISILAANVDGRDYLRWMTGQSFDVELLKVVKRWLGKT